jgi:exosome complex component RRP4
MGELKVQDKEIVVPGEVLAVGMDYLPANGTYRNGEAIIASKVGMVNISGRLIKTISLGGKYLPKKGDTVIGRIMEVNMFGWRIDINCAYSAVLNVKDATSEFIPKDANLNKIFTFDDYIVTNIINVTSQMLVDLSMKGHGLRRLSEGRIVKVNPNKVPRIIGKGGSMVSMIKNATGCRIIVGQNGVIWVSGEPKAEIIAIDTIKKIERESHIQGLTDKIKEHLIQNGLYDPIGSGRDDEEDSFSSEEGSSDGGDDRNRGNNGGHRYDNHGGDRHGGQRNNRNGGYGRRHEEFSNAPRDDAPVNDSENSANAPEDDGFEGPLDEFEESTPKKKHDDSDGSEGSEDLDFEDIEINEENKN